MRSSRRRPLAALAMVFGMLGAGPALAHAILVESTPAAGGTVTAPSVDVSLRYNSRINKLLSRLTLVRPDKSETVLPIAPGGTEDVLVAHADVTPGKYRLHWQVTAIDGHITRGEVPFTVTEAGP